MAFESVEIVSIIGALVFLGLVCIFLYKLYRPTLVKASVETRQSIYELVLYRKFCESKGIDIEAEVDKYYSAKGDKHLKEFNTFKDEYPSKKE